MKAGRYRAITRTTIEFCMGTESRFPTVIFYMTFAPGEVFEIPRTPDGVFYRTQKDSPGTSLDGHFEILEG